MSQLRTANRSRRLPSSLWAFGALLFAVTQSACELNAVKAQEAVKGIVIPTSPAPTSTPSGSPSDTALSVQEPTTYLPPIEIKKGGTYSGNWLSTEMGWESGAVRVRTSEPVVLQNCHLAGPGILLNIRTWGGNVTVRNCSFHGRPPIKDHESRGRAIDANIYANLVVENNYFENTGSVVAADNYVGNGTAQNTLIVRFNRVRNINGAWRNQTNCPAEGCSTFQNFVGHFNNIQPQGNPRFGEIAWNEVINEPDVSMSADLINFYIAGGTQDSWFKIHDNFLKGSYPYPAHLAKSAAGGIQIDGKDHTRTAFIDVYNNTVMQILTGGMGAAAGSHIRMHDNRIVSSGKDPQGNWWPANYGGVWLYDEYKSDAVGVMTDILIENNVIGWAAKGSAMPAGFTDRFDVTSDILGGVKNNVHLPNVPITASTEESEYQLFLQKLKNQNIKLGPQKP